MIGKRNKYLKNIIKEEVANIAGGTTSFKSDELKFAEPVNPTFINYESFSSDYDTTVTPATKIIIHWSPVFWKNMNGIHTFNIDVEGVEGIFNLQYRDKQSDELIQETQKNIAEIPWKFSVDEAILEVGKSLYVLEAEFDFKSNVCTLTF